tara:strand:- start:7515 stop:7712 length:198 start_codon:yes stop_codon:yes gene_type:complete
MAQLNKMNYGAFASDIDRVTELAGENLGDCASGFLRNFYRELENSDEDPTVIIERHDGILSSMLE